MSGGTIALVAAPWLIAISGWRGLWTALALVTALCAIAFARAVPVSRYGEVRSLRLVVESLASKGNIAMALLFLCYVAQWNSVMIWLPTFLVDERSASTGSAALATALMVLVNAPGNLLGGWLLTRGFARSHVILGGTLVAALAEVGMLSDALPGAVRFGCVLLFSVSAGVIPASIFAGLPVHAKTPQHIGTANGIVMQASQAGQFLGPMVLAWIASQFGGWHLALWPMLAFAAIAAACGLLIGRIERNRPARR